MIPDSIDNIIYTGVEEIEGFEDRIFLNIGATLYDQAGNWVDYPEVSSIVYVDIIPPTILSINADVIDSAFHESDTIAIFAEVSKELVEDVDVENSSINLNSYMKTKQHCLKK